jgi:hypothetical protein
MSKMKDIVSVYFYSMGHFFCCLSIAVLGIICHSSCAGHKIRGNGNEVLDQVQDRFELRATGTVQLLHVDESFLGPRALCYWNSGGAIFSIQNASGKSGAVAMQRFVAEVGKEEWEFGLAIREFTAEGLQDLLKEHPTDQGNVGVFLPCKGEVLVGGILESSSGLSGSQIVCMEDDGLSVNSESSFLIVNSMPLTVSRLKSVRPIGWSIQNGAVCGVMTGGTLTIFVLGVAQQEDGSRCVVLGRNTGEGWSTEKLRELKKGEGISSCQVFSNDQGAGEVACMGRFSLTHTEGSVVFMSGSSNSCETHVDGDARDYLSRACSGLFDFDYRSLEARCSEPSSMNWEFEELLWNGGSRTRSVGFSEKMIEEKDDWLREQVQEIGTPHRFGEQSHPLGAFRGGLRILSVTPVPVEGGAKFLVAIERWHGMGGITMFCAGSMDGDVVLVEDRIVLPGEVKLDPTSVAWVTQDPGRTIGISPAQSPWSQPSTRADNGGDFVVFSFLNGGASGRVRLLPSLDLFGKFGSRID